MIRILPGNDRCHDRYNVYVHELWFGESLCKMHRKKIVVHTFYFYIMSHFKHIENSITFIQQVSLIIHLILVINFAHQRKLNTLIDVNISHMTSFNLFITLIHIMPDMLCLFQYSIYLLICSTQISVSILNAF